MSNTAKLIGVIAAIIIITSLVMIAFFSGSSLGSTDITLTAEAYYLDYNEMEESGEGSYIEKEDASEIGALISGTYKGKKLVETLGEYNKAYKFAISPVYIDRTVSEIDKYTKDPVLDEYNNLVYGEVIYVFDNKTIGFYDPESERIWIGKKASGDIDIEALNELIEKNPPVDNLDEGDEEDIDTSSEQEAASTDEEEKDEYINPSPYDTENYNH